MVKHQGQILEYGIRKAGYNLSELATQLGVNRRTLYNWFLMPTLRVNLIYRVGKIIRHDFSDEFPELSAYSDADIQGKPKIHDEILTDEPWKDKYIGLLERYNDLLHKAVKK